jgi:tRNA-splicing ligase RtcB
MAAGLGRDDVAPRIESLVQALFHGVPTGVGSAGDLHVSRRSLRSIAERGAQWAVDEGYGEDGDVEHVEEQGCLRGANPDAVSERAWKRAAGQVGTLGAGNHFLEVGYVADVYDEEAARAFGLARMQATVMVHCGSRGFGHQVCDDSLGLMGKAAAKYHISLPDRQLACAPVRSAEGKRYLGAMRAAVNYAFANRQVISHQVREVFGRVFGRPGSGSLLRTVYEVAHNIAKLEKHEVDGRVREVCVHRKGATRAFAPGHPDVPEAYRAVGQPVLIPGDMGRCSYVLAGTETAMRETFGSACHGAGRAMSRHKAVKAASGRDVVRELAQKGIVVQVRSRRTVAEEMSDAYKDVSDVVNACAQAGIARKVARIVPLGCIKG